MLISERSVQFQVTWWTTGPEMGSDQIYGAIGNGPTVASVSTDAFLPSPPTSPLFLPHLPLCTQLDFPGTRPNSKMGPLNP